MSTFHLNPRVAADLFDGEIIIANLDTGLYYTLNGIILNVVKELPFDNYDKIVDSISSQYPDRKEEVREDLLAAWKELLEDKLVMESVSFENNKEQVDIPLQTEFVSSKLNKYADMQDLLMLDPIHEVDEEGWPIQNNEEVAGEISGKE